MDRNGYFPVIFDTDEPHRSYFFVEISIHPDFTAQDSAHDGTQVKAHDRDQVKAQVSDVVIDRIIETLLLCSTAKTKGEILNNIGLIDRYNNLKNNILPAIDAGLLARTIPDKPTSRSQKYITTQKGKEILSIQK